MYSEAFEELQRAAEAEIVRIREQVERARIAEQQFVDVKNAFVQPKALTLPGRVALDVGGKKFFTTAAALKAKRGFFAALCEGVGDVQRDSEGCIFIDRSPLAFRFVLNHLRGEPIDTAMMTALEKEMLMLDAEFYELDELMELLEEKNDVEDEGDGGARKKHKADTVVCDGECICQNCETQVDHAVKRAAQKAEADLNRRQKEWEAKMAVRERLKQKIESTVSSEKIKLQLMQEDAKFSTQQRTLTCKGGMLAAKFSSRERWNADVCDDGSVIDKDGATFEWVLNLLRGYSLPRALTKQQRVSLAHDLEYFGLDLGLMKSGWNLMPSPNGVVSNDGLNFTKTGAGGYNCGVIGSVGWTAGVHEWTVLLEAHGKNLMIGVAPFSLNLQGQNYSSCGFYLCCYRGTLYGQGVDDKACNPSGACNANGTRISVRLDCDAHTLTFGINGTWLPVAYTGLPNVELFPAFDVYDKSCKFTIESDE